jgi:hypothetical protein
MADALLESISACQVVGRETFLITQYGKAFTAKGFGNRFRVWCDRAGLTECSAHGIRKCSATRAAENGATTHELMAMYGWLTTKEAERYTRAASRRKLGRKGATFLKR